VRGVAAQEIAVGQSASGLVTTGITGKAAQIVEIAQATAGAVRVSGAASQTVEVSQIAAGAVRISGVADQNVEVSQAAIGTVIVSGVAAQTVEISQAATGVAHISGAADQAVEVSQSAAGTAAVSGAASQQIEVSQNASGVVLLRGSAAQEIAVEQSASGVTTNGATGEAAQTIAILQTATGTVATRGSAAQEIAIGQSASGRFAPRRTGWAGLMGRLSNAVDTHFSEIISYQPMTLGSIAAEQEDASRPALAVEGIFSRVMDASAKGRLPQDKRGTGRDDMFGMSALTGEARFSALATGFASQPPRKGDKLTRGDGSNWRVSTVEPDADRYILGLVST
jgi:hypothetical protein